MTAMRLPQLLLFVAIWLAVASGHLARADAVAVPTSGGLSADWDNRTYERGEVWAFQPVTRQAIPEDPAGPARNPVDAFIGHALVEKGVARPAAPADKLTLIR